MKDGFLKAAAFSPALRVADCTYNAQQILAQLQTAAQRGVKLAVFPEFCLTGYTCGDLFLQRTLQQGALDALEWLLAQTRALDTVALVGLPLLVHGKLYNCAAVLCRGQLLGIVPKTYLPNYGEFYEKRQFTPGSTEVQTVTVCGQQVPFGTSLLFRCRQMPSFVLGVELCEDLWSALPPSTFHALAGATVIANLSASDETVGKAEYRRALVANQSARLLCGYLYASAGHGESTTDMVFAGHDLIAEDGSILAETAPFAGDHAETELDCQRMEAERARNTSFEHTAEGYITVEFDLTPEETVLTRRIDPAPFVPGDPQRRAARSEFDPEANTLRIGRGADELTVVHELMHAVEEHDPGFLDAEREYFEKRTKGKKLVQLRKLMGDASYGIDEMAFDVGPLCLTPYAFKDYGGDGYELMSMGVELLYRSPSAYLRDIEMLKWVLSMMGRFGQR